MQINIKDKKNKKYLGKQSLKVVAFLFILVLGAKITVPLGNGIPFTLQTLALSLGYYYLTKPQRILSIIVYLLFGIVGLPVFSQGAGIDYFVSWPIGFFLGFVLTSTIVANKKSWLFTLLYFIQIHSVVVLCGFVGLIAHSMAFSKAINEILHLLPGMIIKSLLGTFIVYLIDSIYRGKMPNKSLF